MRTIIGSMRTSPGVTARRLLGHLIHDGPAHRADISRALGVSRTTVTNLVSGLTDADVLLTLDRDGRTEAAGDLDRPPLKQRLGISPRRGVLVSVVCRMMSTAIVVGSLDGRRLGSAEQECSREQTGDEKLAHAGVLLHELLAECDVDASEILRLHLAVNTQCDRESGEVLAQEAAGPWQGVNPKHEASRWSPAPLILENTARLVGLAEYLALPEPRPRSLVYVHLSWGITLGQVVNGEIIGGSHGGAGELGHVSIDPMGLPCACGSRGCLALYTGLDAITERLRAALGAGAGMSDAVEALTEGSHACSTIFADAGETIGRAVAMVCNVVDPDAIVLGGELAPAGPALSSAVWTSLQRRALPLVTNTLDLTLATTAQDPYAAGDAALRAMREDDSLVDELVDELVDAALTR